MLQYLPSVAEFVPYGALLLLLVLGVSYVLLSGRKTSQARHGYTVVAIPDK
jgi:hypothetical protein